MLKALSAATTYISSILQIKDKDTHDNEKHLEKWQKFLKRLKYILAHIIDPIRVRLKA